MSAARLRGLVGPPDLQAWLEWIAPTIDALVDSKVPRTKPSAPNGGHKPKAASKGGAL